MKKPTHFTYDDDDDDDDDDGDYNDDDDDDIHTSYLHFIDFKRL